MYVLKITGVVLLRVSVFRLLESRETESVSIQSSLDLRLGLRVNKTRANKNFALLSRSPLRTIRVVSIPRFFKFSFFISTNDRSITRAFKKDPVGAKIRIRWTIRFS